MRSKRKYHVNTIGNSGGPSFTAMWEALRYAAHVLKSGRSIKISIED